MPNRSRYTDAEREAAYRAMMESSAALAGWARAHSVDMKAARCVAHRWGAAHGLLTPKATPSRLDGADLTRPTADLAREYGVSLSRVIQVRAARGVKGPPRPTKPPKLVQWREVAPMISPVVDAPAQLGTRMTPAERLARASVDELHRMTEAGLARRYGVTREEARAAKARYGLHTDRTAETPIPPRDPTTMGQTADERARELAEIAAPPPVVRIGAGFTVDAGALDYLAPGYGKAREEPDARWLARFEAADRRGGER